MMSMWKTSQRFVYLGLVLLRLGWAILPQTGYIHPDEFFQTVEVVAGDVFDINVERTWEFNKTFPMRSIVIPRLLFQPVFKLLQVLSETANFKVTGTHVVQSSRLIMFFLSVCIDICTWCICNEMEVDSQTAVMLLASSYVMLTYLTHSFSNSIEAVLLVIVILLILRSVHYHMKWGKKQKGIGDSTMTSYPADRTTESNGSETEGDMLDNSYGTLSILHTSAFDIRRRKRQKCGEDIPDKDKKYAADNSFVGKVEEADGYGENISYLTCAILAVSNTAGIFNRPTFVLFSAVPFVWWLSHFVTNVSLLVKRVIFFILISLISTTIFCIADTVYYNNIPLADFSSTYFPDIVFTPINFVLYNTAFENLELHGRHPFCLHILVNMPLLYGPMVFCLVWGLFKNMSQWYSLIFRGKNRKTSSVQDAYRIPDFVPLMFIFAPVLFLSMFPHQEPRFLIPLLPLVTVYTVCTCIQGRAWRSFLVVYCIFNVTLAVLYGILHQGGLMPCIMRLQEFTTDRQQNISSINILFSHTYMPPKHPLLIGRTSNVNVIDLKGADFTEVNSKISELQMKETEDQGLTILNKIYVVIPGTLVGQFEHLFQGRLHTVEKFFPHLSLEDPPVIKLDLNMTEVKDYLSLFLIEVT